MSDPLLVQLGRFKADGTLLETWQNETELGDFSRIARAGASR